jgi:hypothetical protein
MIRYVAALDALTIFTRLRNAGFQTPKVTRMTTNIKGSAPTRMKTTFPSSLSFCGVGIELFTTIFD